MKKLSLFYLLFMPSCTSIPPMNVIEVQPSIVNDQKIELSCQGQGISIEHSRNDAVINCKTMAATYLQRDLYVKARVFDTTNDIYRHEQVISQQDIDGLICIPLTEQHYYSDMYYTALRCKFILKDIQVTKTQIKPEVDVIPKQGIKPTHNISVKDNFYMIFINTIPTCTRITVIGKEQHNYICAKNPQQLRLTPADKRIFLETAGYLPQELDITKAKDLDNFTAIFTKESE
jgi:hypothetical protein